MKSEPCLPFYKADALVHTPRQMTRPHSHSQHNHSTTSPIKAQVFHEECSLKVIYHPSKSVTSKNILCCGSNGGEYYDCHLPACDAV